MICVQKVTSNMLRTLLTGLLCYNFFSTVESNEMGPGLWHVDYIEKCEEATHKFKFEISKKKINRTHDGFSGHLILDEPFDKSFGMRCDVCKMVDGGCKSYQIISDDCFVNFINKFAKNNVKSCLEIAGVDPPEFPLPAGEYDVNDYVFDYTELPEDGPYGKFSATCYMLENTQEVGCIKMSLDFTEDSDDDDDDK